MSAKFDSKDGITQRNVNEWVERLKAGRNRQSFIWTMQVPKEASATVEAL